MVSLRLPQVSGRQLIGILQRIGYERIRQRGSHVRLRNATPLGEHNLTVPLHRELAKGTLNDILNDVAQWSSISKEQLVEMCQNI